MFHNQFMTLVDGNFINSARYYNLCGVTKFHWSQMILAIKEHVGNVECISYVL